MRQWTFILCCGGRGPVSMTVIELPDEEAAALKARAAAKGLSLEEWLRALAAENDVLKQRPSASERRRHISEVIRERMGKVPPQIMAQMPKDGASQHDHYIYGLPKREE